jgi:hypothetical protein
MIKKILAVLVILLIAVGGLYAYKQNEKRTLITPYPYAITPTWEAQFEKLEAKNIKSAEMAKILIVGDRMAKSLIPYEQSLQDTFGASLKTPPTIFNWADKNEPLFRTLFKLKKLNKLPPLVVYFGASSELYERKFDVNDRKAILKNFDKFDDEKIISMIITFPWLSKYFYKKMNYVDLAAPTEYQNNLPSTQKLEEKEISFKLFEYETNELINLVKDKKSNLIFITTPINLESEPKEICSHSSTPELVGLQQEIAEEIKKGNFKTAFPQALELASETYGNAMTFFLLGKAALGEGNLKMAREALLKATVFDCATWRGNAVYNAIMRKSAARNLISVVDFEQSMNGLLSNEGLFIDDIYPQGLFYQNMIKELGDILKKLLSVGE